MAQCRMKLENDRMCGCYLFKCKKCGNTGCDNRDCRNQGFDKGNGMCLSCNQTSARVGI